MTNDTLIDRFISHCTAQHYTTGIENSERRGSVSSQFESRGGSTSGVRLYAHGIGILFATILTSIALTHGGRRKSTIHAPGSGQCTSLWWVCCRFVGDGNHSMWHVVWNRGTLCLGVTTRSSVRRDLCQGKCKGGGSSQVEFVCQ